MGLERRISDFLKVFVRIKAILFFLACASSSFALAADSVSHAGFTWKFNGDHTTGFFVNGEPWVVGPVSLTAIQRNNGQNGSQADKYNGSMLNPVPNKNQGFNVFAQNGAFTYDESLNAAFQLPKTLVPGDSMVSSMHGNGEIQVKRVSTLTVVATPPPSGSFRPAVYGPGPHPVVFNRSQLNTSILKNLVHTAHAPTQEAIDRYTPSGTWLEWSSSWAGNTVGPAPDMVAFGSGRGDPYVDSNYGQQVAQKWGTVALWLNLQNSMSNKERAIISVVQAGIDIAAWLKMGGIFYHNGGHKAGRKLPLLMAAVMLNDPEMLALARNPDHFQEDQSLFFVTQSDVGRGIEPYLQEDADVRLPEWGIRHRFEPQYDSRSLQNPGYRYVNATAMGGAWLAAVIMELKPAWNHPVAFAYMDRIKKHFWSGTNFADAMWEAYRYGTNSIPAPSIEVLPFAKTYYLGDEVRVTLTHSDSRAVIRYTLDGSEPKQDSEVYSRPLEVKVSRLLKTRAFMTGKDPSYIESFSLKFEPAANRPLDRSKWQIINFSSEGLLSNEKANLILDGKENTIWHTRYDSGYVSNTHDITIDLGECVDLTKIGYIPRQDLSNGRLHKYSLHFSKSNNSFGPALVTGNFQGKSEEQIVSLPANARARFIKIVAEDLPFVSIAEIFATGQRSNDQSCAGGSAPVTPAPVTPVPVTPVPVTPAPITPAPVTPAPVTPAPVTPTPVIPVEIPQLSKANWRITASSQHSGSEASKMIDGSNDTFWHTAYTPTFALPPYTIDISLAGIYDITSMRYTPRQDIENGRLKNYSIKVSTDGVTWQNAVTTGTFSNSTNRQTVTLQTPTRAAFIKLTVQSGVAAQGTFASIAELDFAGTFVSALSNSTSSSNSQSSSSSSLSSSSSSQSNGGGQSSNSSSSQSSSTAANAPIKAPKGLKVVRLRK